MKKILLALLLLPSLLFAQPDQGRMIFLNKKPSSVPVINVPVSFLPPFTTVTGFASTNQFFEINWALLTANISIGLPAWLDASLNGTAFGANSILYTLNPAKQMVYFRVKASTAPGTYTDTIRFSSIGAVQKKVVVTVTVSASGATPTINASSLILHLGTTLQGVPGSTFTVTIGGVNLTHDLQINAGGGVEVLENSTNTWKNTFVLSQTGGTVPDYPLSVRLKGDIAGNLIVNVDLISLDADTKSIVCDGTVTSSSVEQDSLVFQVALNRTALNTTDYPDASWDTPYGSVFFTDARNWRQVRMRPIPAAWKQQNAHASSSTGGISNNILVPPNVSQGYFFSDDGGLTTWPGTRISDSSLYFDRLDPTRWYTVQVLCANKAIAGTSNKQFVCIGIIDSTAGNYRLDTLSGVDSAGYINSRLNTGDIGTSGIATYTNVRPNAQGGFWMTVHPRAGGNVANGNRYGLVNMIRIIQQKNYQTAFESLKKMLLPQVAEIFAQNPYQQTPKK